MQGRELTAAQQTSCTSADTANFMQQMRRARCRLPACHGLPASSRGRPCTHLLPTAHGTGAAEQQQPDSCCICSACLQGWPAASCNKRLSELRKPGPAHCEAAAANQHCYVHWQQLAWQSPAHASCTPLCSFHRQCWPARCARQLQIFKHIV